MRTPSLDWLMNHWTFFPGIFSFTLSQAKSKFYYTLYIVFFIYFAIKLHCIHTTQLSCKSYECMNVVLKNFAVLYIFVLSVNVFLCNMSVNAKCWQLNVWILALASFPFQLWWAKLLINNLTLHFKPWLKSTFDYHLNTPKTLES